MGRAVPHEMTDEEMELFSNRFRRICQAIDGTPAHLVTPLLLRVAVGSYLDLKGFTESDATVQLAQDLIADLTHLLLNNTERHIKERN